jgi:hypothetical protein
MTTLQVVTARVTAAARAVTLLAPGLDLSAQASGAARGGASGTEAEAALATLCKRLEAAAGQVSEEVHALGNATARAAECYRLADEYAMPREPRGR